jgi:hypothetical protein
MEHHRLRALLRLALVALAAALPACSGSHSGASGPVPPGVSALTPATGTVSTLVLVTGAGFGAAPSVTFSSAGHDYVAVLTTASDTRLEARVPSVDPGLAASGVRFDVTIRTAAGGAATLPGAYTMARPVVADVNGGLVGSGATGSPFIVDGAAFGDPTALGSTFAVEFCDTTGNAFPAAVSAEAWTNGFVVGTVPNGLGAGRRYDVKVTTPSGTSAPRPFVVLGGVTFSPSNIGWSTAPALPAPVQGLAAVVVPILDPGGATTSYVFTLGGNGSTVAADDRAANTTGVAVNELVAAPTSVTGPFAWTAWRDATPLPEARAWAAAVAAGPGNSVVASAGEVYVLGGLDPAGAPTSGVYRAAVAADGTLGAWSPTAPLPAARAGHGAVVFHGRVYVAGGSGADGRPAADVWSARIQPDGTLGAWTALAALPAPVAFHQLVSYAGYLFVLGGTPQPADPVASTLDPTLNGTIWSAELDLRDGSLVEAATSTVWVDVGPLSPKPREKFTAVVAGSYLLLTGGLYSGAPLSTEESYAAFQTGALLGTVGSFSGATGSHTIYKASGGAAEVPYGHAAVPFVDAAGNAHVIVLGGGDVSAGAPHAEVWFQY